MRERKARAIACLSICFALFAASTFVEFAAATTSDLTGEVDQLIGKIQDTADDCWKKPSSSRKATMVNKLNALRELIEEENIEEAYDKLLHSIKPKLTGLKTDENEEPWAKGVFKNPWVVCETLREELRSDCNRLLLHLKMGSIYDDDTTPPTIEIDYIGEYHTAEPGFWIVKVQDLDSGLDEVEILVDGTVYFHHQDLDGTLELICNVPVPPIRGTRWITVRATNNDKDWDGDQESSEVSEWWYISVPPDETPPIIIG